MPAFVVSSGSILPPEFPGKLTIYVVFSSLVAASGGLLFGYDIGITGGVTSMADFLRKFFPDIYKRQLHNSNVNAWCAFDSQLLQLFTSSLFLAGMVGGFLGSFFNGKFGRARTMFVGGLFFLGGAALTGLAQALWMLVLGRIMLGLGVGCANQTVPLYLSEIAPSKWRGALNLMFQQATTIGILIAQLINFGTDKLASNGWRISLGLAGVPAIILTVGGIFLPDTPNSLMQRGQDKQALEVLKGIRGVDTVEAEFNDIMRARDISRSYEGSSTVILERHHRPELVWAIAIPIFQQLTGINAIMFYVAPIFKTLGFGSSASLYSAVITGGVNMVATLVGIYFVDRLGRKLLFLEGGIQMIISQVVIGLVLKYEFGDGTKALSKSVAIVVVLLICIYVAAFAWSWGPLGWLVPSEIQPLETRATGQAITVAFNFLFSFCIGQAFLSMMCHLRYGTFLFFAGWVLIMTVAVELFLPETKGIPIEDMKVIWNKHWFWNRYVSNDYLACLKAELI